MRSYSEKEFNEYEEDIPENIYCPMCEKRGYQVHLGPKILMPGEPRPEDYEEWLQCGTCYWLCPIYEASATEEIKDEIELIDNPFESGKIHVLGVERGSKSKRRINNKLKLDDDKEINDLLRIYGDNVTVHQ